MNIVIAYIDPGTSGLMIQALIGGVAGVAAYFKYRTRGWFGKGTPATPVAESTDIAAEDADSAL